MGEISEALRRARDGVKRAEAPPHTVDVQESSALHAAPRRDGQHVLIQATRGEASKAREVLSAPEGEPAAAYRHFAVRLQRELKKRDTRLVLVTSASRGEGKTTTACNLALALASMASGRRIALAEFDVRRPAVATALDVTARVGFEDVLDGIAPLADACLHTQLSELDLYVAARPSRNALASISSRGAGAVMRSLASKYDLVIVDSPPVLAVPDVSLLLPHVDSVLFVVRNGVSRRAALREAVHVIGADKVVGVFLNEGRIPRYRRYEGYYAQPAQQSELGVKDGE